MKLWRKEIQEYCEREGVSLSKLSQLCGKNKSYISDLYRMRRKDGGRYNPSIETMEMIDDVVEFSDEAWMEYAGLKTEHSWRWPKYVEQLKDNPPVYARAW